VTVPKGLQRAHAAAFSIEFGTANQPR